MKQYKCWLHGVYITQQLTCMCKYMHFLRVLAAEVDTVGDDGVIESGAPSSQGKCGDKIILTHGFARSRNHIKKYMHRK